MGEGSRPVNVAFLMTSAPVGGQERVVLDTVRCLDRSRFRPYVYCLKAPGRVAEEIEAAGARVRSGFYASKWDVRVLPRLTRQLRDDCIEVIETVGQGDAMFWGRAAAKIAGVKVIVSAMHSTRDPAGRKVVSRLNHILTPITDRFIALGEAHRDYLAADEGLPAEKMVVIHNGVDCDRFDPRKVDGSQVREEVGASPGTPVVGIVAVLRPEKEHSVLLGAARLVLDRFPNTMFLIVGDGPERANIESQLCELGIEKSVRMQGLRSDIPPVLAALDVAVLCSGPRVETFSIAILEYMAAGKPVVSTRVGSVEDLVVENETAFLVPPRDHDALAEGIIRLLEDPAMARRMGHAARERVIGNFSTHGMARARAKLYESLLRQKA